MISILVELSRKIISKKKPFDSFIVLLLCYLFVEVYYATIKRSGSLAAITRGNKSNLSSVCEDIDKDWSSESNRDWVFNSSLPFPVTRIPALYKDLTQIPKIIHQTWKSKDNIPHQFQIWSDTCKILHPKWEYRLWDDSDNLQFVQDHFDWFLETYNGFPFDISRVDAIRYMVLYKVNLPDLFLIYLPSCTLRLEDSFLILIWNV
jgi:mannosyltransferase OCH1-like enzyme